MAENPLTDEEIALWVKGLGRTDAQRMSTINNLLRNCVGDGMSGPDRAICRTELERLKARGVLPHPDKT